MDYITEKRGGWDEWSDEYEQIIGLKLDTGKVIETRFIDDFFTDTDGYRLEVELPPRRIIGEDEITIERYNPSYDVVSVTITPLEKHMNQEKRIIFFDDLLDEYDF